MGVKWFLNLDQVQVPLLQLTIYLKIQNLRQSPLQQVGANIGMMDGAYFVGRNELLAWINSALQLNLSKIEEVVNSQYIPNSLLLPVFEC